ncbi:hypothetical protein ACFQU2_12995 [Siccirubricoccus deserti]
MKKSAGVALEHIPYRGGAPALIDLRAGRVEAFSPPRTTRARRSRTGRFVSLPPPPHSAFRNPGCAGDRGDAAGI